MKRLALLAPTMALIVACGSNTALQPGNWEMTTKMTDIELPGQPPAMAAQMKQAMAAQAQTQTRCITPQEAANPAGGMMSPSGNAQGCTFSKQTFSGGTIDVAGSCPVPTGGRAETSLTGTYTGTEMNARITANVTGGPQQMRMSGTLTGRRIGDCPG
jgi:hypothetical protein